MGTRAEPNPRRLVSHVPTRSTLRAIRRIERGEYVSFDHVDDAIRFLGLRKSHAKGHRR